MPSSSRVNNHLRRPVVSSLRQACMELIMEFGKAVRKTVLRAELRNFSVVFFGIVLATPALAQAPADQIWNELASGNRRFVPFTSTKSMRKSLRGPAWAASGFLPRLRNLQSLPW